jgi:hypothetical protein
MNEWSFSLILSGQDDEYSIIKFPFEFYGENGIEAGDIVSLFYISHKLRVLNKMKENYP